MIRPDTYKKGRLLCLWALVAALSCLFLIPCSAAASYTPGGIAPPAVRTSPALFIRETTATFNGAVVNDGGAPCQYRFCYGIAPGIYTFNTGWTGSLVTGKLFCAGVTGLAKGTQYYFRAQLMNSAGVSSGTELSFTTLGVALSFTAAATPAVAAPVAVSGRLHPVYKLPVMAAWCIACSMLIIVAGCYTADIMLLNNKGKSKGG